MSTSVVRPLEIFTKAAHRNSIVWLGTCSALSGERPIWQWLWNGAKHRIANDNGAVAMEHRVRAGELKVPSVISGDINSLGQLTKKFYLEKQCDLTPQDGECSTDLDACLEMLRKEIKDQRDQKAPPTLVLGGLSGRLDHTLATLHSLVQAANAGSGSPGSPGPIYVLDGDNLVCVMPKGAHRFHLERAHLTDVCGIVPICQSETKVTTRGFRWNLDNAPLSFGSLISTSNELASDEISVTTTGPVILTFELLSSITGRAATQMTRSLILNLEKDF